MATKIASAKRESPPGPKGLKNAHILWQMNRQPLAAIHALVQTYGDLVHVHLGPYRLYFLNHPEYLHEILVRQADKMQKPRNLSRPIADFLGTGLLISHGQYWKHQRQIMQPAFHHQQINNYINTMLACVQETIEKWNDGDILDIDHEFMKLTLKMVTRTLFSADLSHTGDAIAHAVKILQRISYDQGQAPLRIPMRVPLPNHLRKQRAIKLLDQMVMQIIQERRQSKSEKTDLLNTLINAVDMEGQPLSDQQIRDEVMTILLAGHESTANAMTWMWYLLAQHPPVETSLAQELSLILDCKPLTAETLRQLTYTGMVVNEALRLYPPAWALPREATENVIIGDYVIGKGSLLFGVPYIIHRDPRYYKDPESFVPERFANAREMPRHTYLPFGGGPRYCIGNNFALVAMQIALAAIHQHFRFQIIEEQEIVLDPLLTLRPRFGLHMRLISHG